MKRIYYMKGYFVRSSFDTGRVVPLALAGTGGRGGSGNSANVFIVIRVGGSSTTIEAKISQIKVMAKTSLPGEVSNILAFSRTRLSLLLADRVDLCVSDPSWIGCVASDRDRYNTVDAEGFSSTGERVMEGGNMAEDILRSCEDDNPMSRGIGPRMSTEGDGVLGRGRKGGVGGGREAGTGFLGGRGAN